MMDSWGDYPTRLSNRVFGGEKLGKDLSGWSLSDASWGLDAGIFLVAEMWSGVFGVEDGVGLG